MKFREDEKHETISERKGVNIAFDRTMHNSEKNSLSVYHAKDGVTLQVAPSLFCLYAASGGCCPLWGTHPDLPERHAYAFSFTAGHIHLRKRGKQATPRSGEDCPFPRHFPGK
jgi:hypothetical protein